MTRPNSKSESWTYVVKFTLLDEDIKKMGLMYKSTIKWDYDINKWDLKKYSSEP